MSKKNKKTNFDRFLEKELEDDEFREEFEKGFQNLKIGYKINKARKERGMSQRELAEEIGTAQSNISRIEKGDQNISSELLYKIAKALNKELVVKFQDKDWKEFQDFSVTGGENKEDNCFEFDANKIIEVKTN